jgi:hypothetical protein
MNKVIVYLSQSEKSNELTEYFQNLAYEPLFTDTRTKLLSACSKKICAKVFLEISTLSDILLINAIKEIDSETDIVLILKPGLEDIVSALQNENYQTVNSIMNLSACEHKQ